MGVGVVWTRPDVVCEHHLVSLHLGPLNVSLYDGHDRERKLLTSLEKAKGGVPATEIRFRHGGSSTGVRSKSAKHDG